MSSGDSVVDAIIRKFQERSAVGQKKYGVTLDRTDLNVLDWIKHAQEELMDGILYLERLAATVQDAMPRHMQDPVKKGSE